jgi:alanine-synthesizing transaminase
VIRPRFSARTSWDLAENRLSQVVAAARARGIHLLDLTESNPTRAGIVSSGDRLASLGHPRAARYEPLPHGHPIAREAVCGYYAGRALELTPEQVTLTASTSEAYGWLFKLLCDRDDEVLVPAPSYPLLSFLACLEDVRLESYPLVVAEGFRIDLDALVGAIDAKTRAIVLVHPNNPTGTFVRRDEADALDALAARHGIAIVVDEVFGDFAHGELPEDRLPSFVGERQALTFVLSGLSKVVAMPQVKLGWIATLGPRELVREASRRLEVIADSYLSVSTPVQLALPEILAGRAAVQAEIRARVMANLMILDQALASVGLGGARLPSDGGWYAIVVLPPGCSEEALVERLVEEDGVITHPGYFFDMTPEGFLVVSLLPERATFAEGARRVAARIAASST